MSVRILQGDCREKQTELADASVDSILMRYLCRLVTPKGGTVLDPFMGSGSTLKAAELEGFSAIGIEIDPEYCEIARKRIASDAPLFAEVA